jgi:hypothetical protein
VTDSFQQQQQEETEAGEGGLIREFRQLKIANDAKFQQVPNPKTEREILYITGRSGSGKSTYTRKYLEEYKKKFRKRPIYMFSALPDDPSLDSIEPKRIELDDSLITEPIKAEDLKDSAVIFDDIDVLSNKKVRDEVYKLLNQVLEIGRHFNITCIVTNHLPTNGKDTRRILNEAHSFTYFPHAASGRIKYFQQYVTKYTSFIRVVSNPRNIVPHETGFYTLRSPSIGHHEPQGVKPSMRNGAPALDQPDSRRFSACRSILEPRA